MPRSSSSSMTFLAAHVALNDLVVVSDGTSRRFLVANMLMRGQIDVEERKTSLFERGTTHPDLSLSTWQKIGKLGPSTYYEILAIGPQATKLEIRLAYLKLILLHHPDKRSVPSAALTRLNHTTTMVTAAQLNSAYSILSDEESRLKYDQSLWAATTRDYSLSP